MVWHHKEGLLHVSLCPSAFVYLLFTIYSCVSFAFPSTIMSFMTSLAIPMHTHTHYSITNCPYSSFGPTPMTTPTANPLAIVDQHCYHVSPAIMFASMCASFVGPVCNDHLCTDSCLWRGSQGWQGTGMWYTLCYHYLSKCLSTPSQSCGIMSMKSSNEQKQCKAR